MLTIIDRLRTLRVSQAMEKNVLQIYGHQSLEEVARQFVSNGISSAPVVDEKGSCVGMLSAADYLSRDTRSGDEADIVERYMARDVHVIASNASLLDAARAMAAAHVHRLPVVDDGRVVGIVTTTDIITSVLHAADELDIYQLNDF